MTLTTWFTKIWQIQKDTQTKRPTDKRIKLKIILWAQKFTIRKFFLKDLRPMNWKAWHMQTIKNLKFSLSPTFRWMKEIKREKLCQCSEITQHLQLIQTTLTLPLPIMRPSLRWRKTSQKWFKGWKDRTLKKAHSFLPTKKRSFLRWFLSLSIKVAYKVQQRPRERTVLGAEFWPRVKSLSLQGVFLNSKISRMTNIKRTKILTF